MAINRTSLNLIVAILISRHYKEIQIHFRLQVDALKSILFLIFVEASQHAKQFAV